MISYSSLSDLKKCPYQYFEKRVLRLHKFAPGPEAALGDWVHVRLQHVGEGSVSEVPAIPPELTAHSTPEKLAALRDGIDWATAMIKQMFAQNTHFEAEFNIDPSLTRPVNKDWKATYNWTGKADLFQRDGTHGFIGDWKTGSSKFPDTDQLELMAVFGFIRWPELQTVDAALVFLGDCKVVPSPVWSRAVDFPTLREKWLDKAVELKRRTDEKDWPKTPNALCGWCPCTSCEHNAPAKASRAARGK